MPTYDEVRGTYKAAERGLTDRFGGSKLTEGKVVEAEGETTLVTPGAGKQVTLYWVGLVASEANASEVLASVKLGTKVVYEWYLGKGGAFAHWEPEVGAENAKLVLKLSAALKVAVDFTYSESVVGA